MQESRFTARGFTLVEVLIATALLVAVSVGVVQLYALSTLRAGAARDQTSSAVLAAARLEQLKSLTWEYAATPAGVVPRSDTSSNLSRDVPDDTGPGLGPSPSGTLTSNVPPYVDYLDSNGRWVGNGTVPPPRAMFVRRWAVTPLPRDPVRGVILTVRVTTVADEVRRGGSAWRGRVGSETVLVTVRARKGT